MCVGVCGMCVCCVYMCVRVYVVCMSLQGDQGIPVTRQPVYLVSECWIQTSSQDKMDRHQGRHLVHYSGTHTQAYNPKHKNFKQIIEIQMMCISSFGQN